MYQRNQVANHDHSRPI